MSDLKEQIKQLEAEAKAMQARQAQLVKTMRAGVKKANAVVEYAEKELKKAQSEPDPARRERLVRLNQLRIAGGKSSLEALDLLANAETMAPQHLLERVELTGLKAQYLLTEYNHTNYTVVMGLLEEALGIKKSAPSAEAVSQATAPGPRSATAPLGALPSRAVQGSGPLPPAPPRPAAPIAPRPPMPRPPMPPRPGVPGTGRLPSPIGRPGTGPLNEGPPAIDPELGTILKDAAADPATRDKLKDLLIRVRDLEISLQPLRGDVVGELSILLEDAVKPLREIAGKVYYINRVLTTLGPLGEKMPWCADGPDPALQKLMTAAEDAPMAPAVPAAGAAGQPAQMSGRLRSLFSK